MRKSERLFVTLLALVLAFVTACAPSVTSENTEANPSPAPAQEQASEAGEDEQSTKTEVEPTVIIDDAEDDAQEDEEAPATSQEGNPEQAEAPPADDEADSGAATDELTVEEDGWYTSKEEVALYIHTFGKLPGNFISKTKARKAGWDSKAGNLDEVLPGMSIGGSTYYNEGWDGEELLPEKDGRTWKECDINYHGGYRGPERLVFSNDGLIFYTADHYETFEQLY